jgi:hypothetical protein
LRDIVDAVHERTAQRLVGAGHGGSA